MKWRLDKDAAALLHAMTGSDDIEDATEVTLFVGESRDDDGKLVYGLHAYESEYPEEGVVPLLEFDPPTPAGPTDNEIAAWADRFVRQQAYNRPVAVQIATDAAKWVRSRTAGLELVRLSAFIDAAHVLASDMPHTVVQKLQAAIDAAAGVRVPAEGAPE